MKIYDNNYILIAEGEEAIKLCNECGYHEITSEGRCICQMTNEEIKDRTEFECQII